MLITIEPPSAEPVSPADVKATARIDGAEFDAQIPVIIGALRQHLENTLHRRLITQILELVLDDFPAAEIDLQVPDVTEVVSVVYLDANGASQTLPTNAYTFSLAEYESWLHPAYGTGWPATRGTPGAVRIRFKAGALTADKVPAPIRHWLLCRATVILDSPDGMQAAEIKPLPFIDSLLDPYRVYR